MRKIFVAVSVAALLGGCVSTSGWVHKDGQADAERWNRDVSECIVVSHSANIYAVSITPGALFDMCMRGRGYSK
jgi:hypothetical protein